MSLSRLRIHVKPSAPASANGMAISTASGRPHRSYSAARIRYTMMIAKPNAKIDALPVRFSWYACPVHSIW